MSGAGTFEGKLGITAFEYAWYRDVRRAFVIGHAITAASAFYKLHGFDSFTHLKDHIEFFFVKRLKIAHGGRVILHLLHIAHTGEHHEHVFKARGKTHGIRSIAVINAV